MSPGSAAAELVPARGGTVLLVEDEQSIGTLVRSYLDRNGYGVVWVRTGEEALAELDRHSVRIVILDVGLPGIDGLFYTTRLRENPTTRRLPIVVISGSEANGPSALAAGATAFVQKPFDPLELLTLLERSIGVTPLEHAFGPDVPAETAHENAEELRRLIEIGRRRHEAIDGAYRSTLSAIAASLEIRGLDSAMHTHRVAAYAMRLTVEVALSLSDDQGLEWGYTFHDIGNIGIPDRILLKRGSLRNDEWLLLHQHTVIGDELLRHVPLLEGEGIRVVRSHHERWDGSGYPDGLAGLDIPLGARIFSVADALDAMTDRRPYRRPLRWEAAIARIRKGAGTQFDPDVVDGLVACEPDLVEIRARFAESGEERKSNAGALLTAALDS